MSLKKYLEKFAGDPPSNFKPVNQRGKDETPSVGAASGSATSPPGLTVDTRDDVPPKPVDSGSTRDVPPRPRGSGESPPGLTTDTRDPENLSPTTGDMFKWLAPMGIGGAAGAGIQAWRRSRKVDALMDEGFTEDEAEEIVDTSVGSGAVIGAGLGAGYKYVSDNRDQLQADISDKLETLKNYFKQK